MEQALAYDVGAHRGSDTAHYLSLGLNVIAIEADPTIAAHLRGRFAPEIERGQVKLLECGIAEREGTLPFYVCPELTEWNSFDPRHASSRGKRIVEVPVRTRRFESVLAEHGTPLFLKVDIEGLDALCIRALTRENAPRFVSFEADKSALGLVSHLYSIGFRRFALVDQYSFAAVDVPRPGRLSHVRWSAAQVGRRFSRSHPRAKRAIDLFRRRRSFESKGPFEKGSAGPAPMEREGGWQDLHEFAYTWSCVRLSGILTSSWFDIHAER